MDTVGKNMDSLLRGKSLNFSIDEISYNAEKNLFSVRIIPDIKSRSFLPFHLRFINVSPELVSEGILQRYSNYGFNFDLADNAHRNSVIQGGYYQLDKASISPKIWDNLFKEETVIDKNNDIFTIAKKDESPYIEENIFQEDDILKISDISTLSSNAPDVLDGLFLYCFNVGQGDSFLLITPNGNSYLIDTNIHKLDSFVKEIKQILKSHSRGKQPLKGLIITHKHIDHIRGASQLLDSQRLKFENFLINMDYKHPTKAVNDLILSANRNFPNIFNINGKGLIIEGKVKIYINNPDTDTVNSQVAPDINDSSICLYILYGNTMMYLTGDAGYLVINKKFVQHTNNQDKLSFLKVSHHGSETGTDNGVLNLTNPIHAFISAGNNKGYNHPDKKVISLLTNYPRCQVSVSKKENRTVLYKSTGNDIIKY
jgi:beta-lactamase superfamily II metal-dependent hydrolase